MARAKISKLPTKPTSVKVLSLPPRKSPKQLARSYMMGELAAEDYPERGGLRKAMLLADGAMSDIAVMQALIFIEKLADLQHDVDPQKLMQVKLIPIKNDGADNAIRIDTA